MIGDQPRVGELQLVHSTERGRHLGGVDREAPSEPEGVAAVEDETDHVRGGDLCAGRGRQVDGRVAVEEERAVVTGQIEARSIAVNGAVTENLEAQIAALAQQLQ